jgi:predicted polyphosphate/ATP-dependent NAD kinase
MSEAKMDESVENSTVETPDVSVETSEVSVETSEIPVTEPIVKPKRKRTEKQIAQLQTARKNAAKKRKVLSKPIKIERKETPVDSSDISSDFSWSKEALKTVLVGALGLTSIYVQRQLSQKEPTVTEEKKEEKIVKTDTPKMKVTQPNQDPFGRSSLNQFLNV